MNAAKLAELGVIPVIFVIQTLVSYLVSIAVARCFGFNRRASNFVTAMGVFGNSNSLPISLVVSLSKTLKSLRWDKLPNDNDEDVAARGILYLLIFQQLGQLVRWSWGYHVLLAPKHKYPEYRNDLLEEGNAVRSGVQQEDAPYQSADGQAYPVENAPTERHHYRSGTNSDDSTVYDPAGQTPTDTYAPPTPTSESGDDDQDYLSPRMRHGALRKSKPFGRIVPQADENSALLPDVLSFPSIEPVCNRDIPAGIRGVPMRVRLYLKTLGHRANATLPPPVRHAFDTSRAVFQRTIAVIRDFMNPPLWAMLFALIVASIPVLQKLFFQDGSFVKNSVTAAVTQSGSVAVPLILVVLGANLARNTQQREDADPEEKQIGNKLLVASLISRMVLPTVIMAPLIAVCAKYIPVSILDDPVFVVVCFLLTGAPSALQLAQICQINGVYENKMSQILFQSYVVW